MRIRLPAIVWLALLATTAASLWGVSVQAQTSPKTAAVSQADTIFTEIKLTPEGVVAVDTGGNQWSYDFEKDTFVPRASLGRRGRVGEGKGALEATAAPVEQRCTEEKTVKPFQRSVLVGYDEYVDGDIIAYGRVTIQGWVKGNVQSINGRVLVAESGQVDGDIKAPEITVKQGGKVEGKRITTNPFLDFPTEALGKSFSGDGLIVVLSLTAFLLMIAFLAESLIPRQMSNIRACMGEYKARSFLLGFLLLFLSPLVILLMIITVVGIVLVPFLPLAYVIAGSLGVITAGAAIFDSLGRRFGKERPNQIVSALAGTGIFMLVWVAVAILLGSADEVSQGFGIFFLVVAILVTAYPFCSGIGAALLARFGFRVYESYRTRHPGASGEAPMPAPPPIPQAPSIVAPPTPPRSSGRDSQPPLSTEDH
jgi:hypothetical protein